jgi:alpha-ketoglutaric semialdehyde dehydrogenase
MDQHTVSSVIAGRPAVGAPGGRIRSTNPARLDEVVADVALGDAGLLVTAARAARDGRGRTCPRRCAAGRSRTSVGW